MTQPSDRPPPVIDLVELDEDEAPFLELGVGTHGTRTIYLADGLRALISPDGRVLLRSDRHLFAVTHLHSTSVPGAVSQVSLELTRGDR